MKGRKSYVLTIIIYGLIIYIIFNFINMGTKKIFSDSMLENIVKKFAKESILSVGYITKTDNDMLNESNKELTFLSKIINVSAYNYANEKIAVNTAESLDIRCFSLENTREESSIDNENDINNDTNDGNNSKNNSNNNGNNSSNSGNDSNNKNNGNSNNGNDNNGNTNGDGQGNITDKITDSNGQDTNQSDNGVETAGQEFKKLQDIKTEDLTYEYLMSKFYTVVSSTTLYPEDIDANKLMAMDMKMQTASDMPQILIYHTHGQEAFADSVSGDLSTTIIGVGDYLTKLLTEIYGYNVIHLKDSFDYVNGVLDRHKAYDYAYERVAQVLAENPSIEVVIDLHRDGVNDNLHLVTEVNGKQTAKIMFFNGISRLNSIGEIGYLYNPYREQNLAFSLQMKVLAEEYFTGFTRKNYIQAYQYNLHLRPKSMLIEAGAQTNTVQEELNAMEPLAKLLDLELKGER
ncbi:MAG: stage II sporulation protein P [Lachnospiraceae bacterium]|nr:stage II sporulation protein P [Clostridiales bacterium]MDD6292300.1 stage II sporulation protein P [Eubacteriales bacterium]MDY2607386.1 stage II sporulation protein P [Lachnospiraceae bacterium]